MPSPNSRGSGTRKIALLGVFLGYTMVISLLERMIPLSLSIPGLRLGLANVAVLLAMYLFPWSWAMLLVFMKCLTAAIFGGSPVALFYSLGGSLLSFAVMLLLLRLLREHISPLGVSIAGAAFHNIGQILVACLLLQSWAVLFYLPFLLLFGLVTGAVIGILVGRLRPHLQAHLISLN
ncbi:MAG: Gx transporter family protein [Clostridiales bacterium]|nr:Gx transporter family protein [Clostridiales bacterium]